ncbi:MAG: hypothetical protein Q9166_005475 [cf. Caloplaca sp. 2 TL-2023]
MSFLPRRAALTSISAISAAAGATIYYHIYQNGRGKKMLPSYEATFSVPLECDACVQDIKGALSKVDGITSTSFSIPSRLVSITSTTAPSTLITTIQSTGRDAILRGTGAPNSAAVCILEIPPSSSTSTSDSPPTSISKLHESPVRGLARLIQLSEKLTLLDLTLTSLPKGRYSITVRKTGDISRGAKSLGDVYRGEDGEREGELGMLEVDGKGRGNLIGEVGWRVWELVGRGMCVQRVGDGGREEEEEVVGVVARSAGVWENEKVVCGCSGKTVWEEREEMVGKGMM